jgi:hypothetical protein
MSEAIFLMWTFYGATRAFHFEDDRRHLRNGKETSIHERNVTMLALWGYLGLNSFRMLWSSLAS